MSTKSRAVDDHNMHGARGTSLPDMSAKVNTNIYQKQQYRDPHPQQQVEFSREKYTNGLTNGDVQKRVHEKGDDIAGVRTRFPTENGLQYRRSVYEKNRKTAMKQVTRLIQTLNSLFESYENNFKLFSCCREG